MKREEEIRIVHTTGLNNCGGRCVIHAHVKDGKILRLTTDDREHAGDGVPLCACAKGLNYHRTLLGGDRLLWPMKRVGERGEGRFERISWDEALDTIAREWTRIRDTYGPGSRYVNYATGISGLLSGSGLAKRLLSLDGGYLGYYNSYSSACISQATQLMYGTKETGNSLEDWLNSRLIVLWGHNPAETHFDSATMHMLRKAREKGIPIVVVDPRKNDTVLALDAEWIPIRPATDSAMMDAMAYVIVEQGLQDQAFLDRCCIGFDRAHMPEGVDPGQCYLDYLTGRQDGVARTPEWAEAITGVPASVIRNLAVRYATARPAALVQGYGPQRHVCGEQIARGGILLACMTGNVGVSGGWASGSADCTRHQLPDFPCPANPYGMRIPSFLWTEAVLRGHELTALDGVTGGEQLQSDIKMIVNLAGNCLINQHGDINRTARILRDSSRCEFILCSDLFMTASAKFADILLPGVSVFENENITMPWKYGDFLGYTNRAIEPLGECRFEYDWLAELAGRLGLGAAFTEGRSSVEWLEYLYEELRRTETELPPFEQFRQAGIHRYRNNPTVIAFRDEVRDPEAHPFPTPSGKIELFSEKVYRTQYRSFFPAIPRYVEPEEGPADPLTARYPLQLIGWHTKRRCHSIHDNNAALHRLDPQRLWIHPDDAARRGVGEGDAVLIWNDRGRVSVPAHLTDRIMPGVVALSQGAWYRPDPDGIDRAGSINVLTSLRTTAYARGNTQHTILVEVGRDPAGRGLNGRRIVFLGSSVTYGEASGGVSFVEELAGRFGCVAVKEAVSGTTLADDDDSSYLARLRRLKVDGPVDLLLCQLSTNDARLEKPLGRPGDSDPHTVAGAIAQIAALARARWNCPVAFYTSPRYDSEAYGQMVALLDELAPTLDVGVIDLWNDEAFNRLTDAHRERWMQDAVHPTLAGYREGWTPHMERKIREYLAAKKP